MNLASIRTLMLTILLVFSQGMLQTTMAMLQTTMAENTGIVRGTVEDPSGQPVLGAELKLKNKTTLEKFKTTSNESGEFTFTNVPNGDYVLSAKAEGLEEAHASVGVGTPNAHPIRFRLEIAEKEEEVTVTANSLSSPSASENVDLIELNRQWLENFPKKDGDPLAVASIFLDPAALGGGSPKIVVDGVESDALEVPTSSVRKVYINKNPYSAEFGKTGKGRIEVTTRRGSYRNFRGMLTVLARNSVWDARNAFATVQPLAQRAIPELMLSGPLGQKVSFFLAGRYSIDNESTLINAQTPEGGLVANFKAPERKTYLLGRMDFKFTPTETLTVSYQFKNKSQQNQGVGGFNLPERATDFFGHKNEFKISERAIFSPNLLNEVRLAIKQEFQQVGGLVDQPGIIVLDAFSAGGAQVSQHRRETTGDLEDIISVIKGKHAFRFGGGIRPRFFRALEASNFGGTFMFSDLSAFLENSPFLFKVNQGDPRVRYRQHESYGFLQDEMQLRQNLSLSLGLRYETQSNLDDTNNFAPRLAFAYSPKGGQTVLRGGAGVFYERQPEVMQLQSLLYNGSRIRQVVVSDPAFPNPFDPEANLSLVTPSVVRIAPGIRAPYIIQGSFAVERKLGPGQNYLTVEYSTIRGLRLYRMRNINAPVPGILIRPDPNYINIDEFESSGTSRSHSLNVMFRGQLRKRFQILSQYALSRTEDDTGGLFYLPADNYDLRSERARADFDRRHRFNLAATWKLPWDVRVSGIVTLSSSIPYNITTGFDSNRDTVANDRPPGVWRNTGRGPRYANVDARLQKTFKFRKDARPDLELALDAFNVFNHANFKNFIGTNSSPFFGLANAAYPARQLQVSLRFRF